MRATTRISTRVQATLVIASSIVFTLIATIVGLGVTQYSRSLAAEDATNRLQTIRQQLDLEARELDALILGFAEWNAFYDATVSPDPTFTAAEFDPWLREQASASAVVWTDSAGTVLSRHGDSADITTLLALATRNPDGVRGPMLLDSGPCVVAIRPIVGDPAVGPVGTVAVARPLSVASVLSGDHTVEALPPAGQPADESGWQTLSAPRGYSSVVTRARGGWFVTRAALTGVDGEPAVTIVMERPDPGLGQNRLWLVVLVPAALGLVTVGLGYLLGMGISRTITGPLHQFVAYLQDQGYLALQGLRTDDGLIVDPSLPSDFAELGGVITDLMTQLRINQSELLEANDQALAAERAFRTVVEESPELKILVRGGVVEIANPAAAHFFGLRLGDLLRAEPNGLFAGIGFYDESGAKVDLLEVARKAAGRPSVVRCVADDQPDRWMEVSVAFIDASFHDYVISARNVTEERRLEALREEVLALASHDLRSPLTVVRGYLDILERPIADSQRETAVKSARRATERLEGLLNDLLYATRAERVLAPQVLRPVDLASLAGSVATSLQVGAVQTISMDAEPGVSVLGDSDRLEQAVTNLVGNAVKHGPPDGEVRIKIFTRNEHAVVAVEDDGPGIPAEQRETLFERGVRGSKETPGMGLGLYIVRIVAEAHNGQAFVEPTGNGTRFVIELPLMPVAEDAS